MCCQFSHQDSHTMCVGLLDGTVQLLKNGKTSYSYRPHEEKVTHISFSSNDSSVASGAYDGSVALLSLDIKSTKMLNEPTGKAVVGLQWSPHSPFKLVTTAMDGLLYIWDTSTRCLKSRHCLHPRLGASSLTLSPVSESLVITVGHDNRLVLFDMRMAREESFVCTPETLESVAFLPDGQRVVGGATSGSVYLYDLRHTRQTPPSMLGTHMKPVTAIATMNSVQAEEQMMALASTIAASEEALASSSSGRVQRDIERPLWLLLGSDMEAAGDLGMDSTLSAESPTSPRDAPHSALTPGDGFQEAADCCILDASWVSTHSSTTSLRDPPFRLSDILPVLNDSLPDPEMGSTSMTRLSVKSALQEKSQAAAVPAGSPHVNGSSSSVPNGHSTSWDASLASSSSAPSMPDELLQNVQVEGAAAMDVKRQPDDLTLAECLRRLEGMMASHDRNTEDLLAEQKRYIDAHLRHIHIQVTMMGHSFMRDIRGMLQEVFDEVAALRADIAALRNDV
ncbi:uncharacterized protein LOC119437333 [Dermacentor silvarum]|uniref:uncharacterized protein LOC119437333 n=1 Tax=Dermacentor silvarum TaxID=543639 RepID=UPI0021007251|nr:uncharacterized protein LOC119437333 [Dermacentor silvarum]